jgi:hypothetical protein
MARTMMAVYSNPVSPEREQEYNTWYDQVHLKELLEIPGVVGATRYTLGSGANAAASEHRYLAIYELDGPADAVFADFVARAGDLTMSPAIDSAGARILFWEPVAGSPA